MIRDKLTVKYSKLVSALVNGGFLLQPEQPRPWAMMRDYGPELFVVSRGEVVG